MGLKSWKLMNMGKKFHQIRHDLLHKSYQMNTNICNPCVDPKKINFAI